MKITDLLREKGIELNGQASDKTDVIDKLVQLMATTGSLADVSKYKEAVLQREAEGTTGIGEGVAIPHAKTDAVRRAGITAMVLRDGVDYESLDGQLTRLIFLIAAPDTEDNIHLDVLGRLSVLLMDDGLRQKLIESKSVQDFLAQIDRAEQEKFAQEEPAIRHNPAAYRFLAVTACPTGIAHTYMAAEALENAAKDLGCSIKVETNGSGGDKNVLTAEEIAACDCIIIAADKKVNMERFDGKRVISTSVARGIHKAKELIGEAAKGEVPVYRHQSSGADAASYRNEKEGVGRGIYKNLMNGVSHMLPFVTGGGILIALSFLFDSQNAGADNFGTGNPLSLFLNLVGNAAFGMMFPILAGYIAMSIGDRPALMVGIVGGLLAKAGTSIFLPEAEWVSSGFFGALIAGFIAGYLVVGLRWLFDKLPAALEGTKPVLLYPFFGILLIGAIMVFLVNPPVGLFNTWLNGVLDSMGNVSKVLLGIVLGGMMSIDFGGPFNKAAYVFGTASIASGQLDIMAAVLIGGMVPPLAIALATTFFRNRFTRREQQTTITNYIMGLSFITEGAIPFAAADPLRIIPPCIVGSAVAGGLSMLFGCTSRAPHGGIFVVGIIGNWPMFLLSLVIGSVIAMLGIVLLKKRLTKEQIER